MRITVFADKRNGSFTDPTAWQNTTLRYAPPRNFPAYLAENIGRAKIMRVFITLDEYWEIFDDTYYLDYEIGKARVPVSERHFAYDWGDVVPAPAGTSFEDYLQSHAENADELLLNVRRLEREVSDGIITYEKYTEVFSRSVEYCKKLAPNIRYIECCNEVDLEYFGNLTADEYVKIYLCAHAAIKELNKKHNYEIPLEIGGYAAAFPINRWDMFSDVMRLLKKTDIGDCPMDFYSYHHYEAANMPALLKDGCFDIAETSDIDKLKLILRNHNKLAEELKLPRKPVFLDELGRAASTGIKANCLYNAAGLLTYLIAFENNEFENMYPFPWCTFHNPSQQISYTQFILNDDGSYSATPNGIALIMLHRMRGYMLSINIENAFGRDVKYRAMAVRNSEMISVICVNPTSDITPCRLSVNNLPDGNYTIDCYQCSENGNNCVTSNGSGKLEITKTISAASIKGVLAAVFPLGRDNFILCEIRRNH